MTLLPMLDRPLPFWSYLFILVETSLVCIFPLTLSPFSVIGCELKLFTWAVEMALVYAILMGFYWDPLVCF